MRRVVLAAAAVAALYAAAPAPAIPPRTCGRVLYAGNTYVVKAHGGITCSFVLRSVRTYLAIGARPRGYKCRAAQGTVPVSCTHRVRKSRYFFATQVR